MNLLNKTLALFILTFGLSAFAMTNAEVIERCSHDIMKLAKNKQIPAEVATKMHLAQVKPTEEGYQVLVVLDHNEDHSQPPAHIKFNYDKAVKLLKHEYVAGYFNPAPSPFNVATTAKLFDIAAEVLFESENPELLSYSQNVTMMHLDYDSEKNAALFEIMDSNKKQLNVWLTLKGELIDFKFIQ